MGNNDNRIKLGIYTVTLPGQRRHMPMNTWTCLICLTTPREGVEPNIAEKELVAGQAGWDGITLPPFSSSHITEAIGGSL